MSDKEALASAAEKKLLEDLESARKTHEEARAAERKEWLDRLDGKQKESDANRKQLVAEIA
jgi:hypothetical protein